MYAGIREYQIEFFVQFRKPVGRKAFHKLKIGVFGARSAEHFVVGVKADYRSAFELCGKVLRAVAGTAPQVQNRAEVAVQT